MKTLPNSSIAEGAPPLTSAAAGRLSPVSDAELSTVGAVDAGRRLEAGRTADERWRRTREEKLRRRLCGIHKLEAVARAGCVVGGLVDVAFVITLSLSWFGASFAFASVSVVAGLFTAVALTVGGLMAMGAAVLRWRLLKRAQQDAVAMPAEVTPTYQASSTAEAGERGRVRRTNQIQQELIWAFREERSAGSVCLWAGYAAVAGGLLLLAVWILAAIVDPELLMGLVSFLLFLPGWLVGMVIMVGLALAAPTSVYHAIQRKRLLRTAVAEGLTVRDPARSPWE